MLEQNGSQNGTTSFPPLSCVCRSTLASEGGVHNTLHTNVSHQKQHLIDW
jgi:hypothetical protein